MGWTLRLLLATGLLSLARAQGAVTVSNLFTDHMVLQQGQPVPVWGWAAPGEKVTVEFAGQTKIASADDNGRWTVQLDPLKASAESRIMKIRGGNELAISDVLVGEVWICAGQSNMAMALAEADNAEEVLQRTDAELRAFRVPERAGARPWDTLGGDWQSFNPRTAKSWSATPYFLAHRLREILGVPVGVIVCAWGGSSAVTWMSEAAVRATGGLVPEDVIGWRSNIQPGKLFNGMLHPVAPYAVAGVTWYQGETDGEPYMNAYIYRQLFPAMIRDWRALWKKAELPFYWVQLPNLRKKELWPILRESQAEALKLPATGMIPTIDIGQEAQLHPANKQQFGDRLANLVLNRSYHKDTWAGAPTYDKMTVQGDRIQILLRDAKGLKTSDGQPPKAFAIAGSDGKFLPATATLAGDVVSVSAEGVVEPKAVRYAWDGNPAVNVVNAAGLPLVPFRTDIFALPGQEWHWAKLPSKAELPAAANGKQLCGDNAAWSSVIRGIEPDDMKKFNVLRDQGTICQIALAGERRGRMTSDSPAIFWEAKEAVDGANGMTVEAVLQVYRATDAFRGFDLEVGLKLSDGRFRRYLVSTVPMRLMAFQKKEIRLLASNLDNMTGLHAYRLTVRPDGMAQVYFDGKPMGLFAGEEIAADAPAQSCIRAGKQVETGEFTVNVQKLSYASGAFIP